jgi:hypothetical protein
MPTILGEARLAWGGGVKQKNKSMDALTFLIKKLPKTMV